MATIDLEKESFFNKIENIRERFFFICGYTNDCFCDQRGIDVPMEFALNEHLKNMEYRRIIFYNKSRKLYFYDMESYDLTMNPGSNAKPSGNAIIKNQRKLSGPIPGRLKSVGKPPETVLKKDVKTLHFGDNELMAFERIDYCMRDSAIKTAVVFSEADDIIRHFGEAQDIGSRITSAFGAYKNLRHTNYNIVIFIFSAELSGIMETYDGPHRNISSDIWENFIKPGIKESASAKKRELEENVKHIRNSLITIEPPGAGEIRNAINYYRLRYGLPVDFNDLDDICKSITRSYNGENKRPLNDLMMRLRDGILNKNIVLNKENCDRIFGKQDEKTALEKLDDLTGMQAVKDEISKIKKSSEKKSANKNKIAFTAEYRSRLLPPLMIETDKNSQFLHYIVTGNPGTGKTTFANLLGKIYYELGYLNSGHTVKVTASNLIGRYIGETAPKTREKIEEAMGGVLFIDEAYDLTNRTGKNAEYANEAIATLLEAMSAYNGRFAVVAAGYPHQMEVFRKYNPGFPSRFKNVLHIDDYTPAELREIFDKNLLKDKCKMDNELSLVIDRFIENYYQTRDDEWANARTIIQLITKMKEMWNIRDGDEDEEGTIILTRDDIPVELQDYCNPRTDKGSIFEPIPVKNLQHDSISREQITESLLLIKTVLESGGDAYASGFIITSDGYLITAYHAIDGAKSIEVRLNNPRLFVGAKVVKVNKEIDIALLKIEGDDFKALVLQGPDIVSSIGEGICLLSYPFGNELSDNPLKLNYSRFEGRIATINEKNGHERIYVDMQAKQGSSGGCVISMATNEVIGILRGSDVRQGAVISEEINYLVPVKYIWQEFIRLNPSMPNKAFDMTENVSAPMKEQSVSQQNSDSIMSTQRAAETSIVETTPVVSTVSAECIHNESDISGQIMDSMFFIQTVLEDGKNDYANGFVITNEGYALTSYRAVNGAKSIAVRLNMTNQWCAARVVKANKEIDLTLLKIEGNYFPASKLQKPNTAFSIGEELCLLSYPMGRLVDVQSELMYAMFNGKIEAIDQKNGYEKVYFVNQDVWGSLGGCVISKTSGEVIGVFSDTEGCEDPFKKMNCFSPIKYAWQYFGSYF